MGSEPSLFRVRLFQTISIAFLFLQVFSAPVFGFPVEISNAPSSNLTLTLRAIKSAKKSLHINIYEFSSPDIAAAIVEQIQKGVHVEILEEGQPFSGHMSDNQKSIESKVLEGMSAGDRFYIMHGESGARRYHFDHAKYVVVDEEALLIGSENYSPSGEPTPGTLGNRGWQVLLHEPTISGQFKTMFDADCDSKFGDIIRAEPSGDRSLSSFVVSSLEPWLMPNVWAPRTRVGDTDPQDSTEPVQSAADSVTSMTSPNTSLDGLVSLLNSAKKSIDIELMTFSSKWGSTGQSSPLLKAVIDAARRGVRIRVLLNDESVFAKKPKSTENSEIGMSEESFHSSSSRSSKYQNPVTAKILNDLAESESLDVSATIADVNAMGVTYIHNKGILVDDDRALISSINWNQNSVMNNREAAVVVLSKDIHDYYEAIFQKDWSVSHR